MRFPDGDAVRLSRTQRRASLLGLLAVSALPRIARRRRQRADSRASRGRRRPHRRHQRGTGRRAKSLSRGDLLVSSDNTFGPGKLVAREGDNLVLEYFDAPGTAASDRYREAVSRASLTRLTLFPELRVFWQDKDDRWRSGRIIEANEHNDIYVRGHEWEGFVPEEQLHVRWNKPLADPVGFGEAGMLESPMLAELRLPFLRSILQQRSAAHGMRCRAIELHRTPRAPGRDGLASSAGPCPALSPRR